MKIELDIGDIVSEQLTEQQCKYIADEFDKYLQSEVKEKLYKLAMHVILCDQAGILYE